MREIKAPPLASSVLTEQFNFKTTPDMKQRLMKLKREQKKDVSAWIRMLVESALEREESAGR